jgi:hypothetical protein
MALPRRPADELAAVAHDARNMVTALALYCDLLREPGVLTQAYRHYGDELHLVAAASRRLVEKLALLHDPYTQAQPDLQAKPDMPAAARFGGSPQGPGKKPVQSVPDLRVPDLPVPDLPVPDLPVPDLPGRELRKRPAPLWDSIAAIPIDNLSAELSANRNLLAALAGPAVTLTVHTEGGALPVRLTGEDLTRVLVNLVKNAAEAMPAGGHIEVGLRPVPARPHALPGAGKALLLTLDDNGSGIPQPALESIFEAGFSTKARSSRDSDWPAPHRGLGLSITRSIIEAAGGTITAANRQPCGARFAIELPASSG